MSTKFQFLNFANIVAFLLNVAATYGIGVLGLFNLRTNTEVSEQYQTIVTPAGYAFAIWGVIFVSQGVFTVAQALPAFRSSDVVVKGVGYYYVLVCVAQATWSFFFASEIIIGSLAAILCILLFLALIVRSLQSVPVEKPWQWAIFKFPFQIHCGWLWAASLVNVNVVLVSLDLSSAIQVLAAWITLGLLAVVSLYYLIANKNYVVPLVVAWASFAVSVELKEPIPSIARTFEAEFIDLLRMVAMLVAIAVLAVTVFFGAYQFYLQRKQRESTTSSRQSATASNAGSEFGYGKLEP